MIKNPIFKIISIVSVITGAIFGIIALLPLISFGVFIVLMFFLAPFMIIYFKHLNLIENLEIEQGILYGAISGFTGFLGFSIMFFPLAFLIDLIFKTETFLWVKVICQNFLFIAGTVFFTALLCSLMNAFTGFMTSYIYQYFKK